MLRSKSAGSISLFINCGAALVLAGCSEIVLIGLRKVLFDEVALTGRADADQLLIIGVCALATVILGRFMSKLSWVSNVFAVLVLVAIEFLRTYWTYQLS